MPGVDLDNGDRSAGKLPFATDAAHVTGIVHPVIEQLEDVSPRQHPHAAGEIMDSHHLHHTERVKVLDFV